MHFPFSLPTGKEFDAAGFGVNAVDHLLVVPHYPDCDTKTRLIEYRQGAGGQTASAIVALQRLGMRTTYAGRLAQIRKAAWDCSLCAMKVLMLSFLKL